MIKDYETNVVADFEDHQDGSEVEQSASSGAPKSKYPPELKMRVVLDSLRSDRTQASVSEEHNVSQPLISIWKRRALQAMMTSLASDYRKEGRRDTMAEKIMSSKSVVETGDLSMELNALKASVSKLFAILDSAERNTQA